MTQLTGQELCKLLEKHGWELRRVHGSHHIYKKPGHRETLSVPVHGSKLLKAGTQSALLRSAGIDPKAG